jgi:Xaa-Pro aminopeptidase
MLTRETLPLVQDALAEAGLDGWLLYDFRGINPIAGGLLGLEGMVTRRVFAWIPRTGTPVALTHAIEQSPWARWPEAWTREVYSSWRSLEGLVARLVAGKRVAMEYSPGDAVPYLDRVPAGVLELVRAAGADVRSSDALVTRFYAVLSADDLASHRRSAEAIAGIARDAFALAGERARSGSPIAEHELMAWILDRFARAGLETDHGPNVSAGANAANPHYEPDASRPFVVGAGEVLLIDLWAYERAAAGRPRGTWADQTWMGVLGAPSSRAVEIWEAVRDARDAAIALVREASARGERLRGADVDDEARRVIDARGFGERFVHRTGHSIDPRELHGSGPHLDNLETREERLLVPGVLFSIEPGVYVRGEIGMRSEVNAWIGEREAIVTPAAYQRELLVV